MRSILNLFRKRPAPLQIDSAEIRLQTVQNINYLSSCIKTLDARIEDLRHKNGKLAKDKLSSLYEQRAWTATKLEEERFNLKMVEKSLKNIF